MKGLIYRELYLSRKSIIMMLIAYALFVFIFSLIMISTYAGNLAKDKEAAEMRYYLYSQMYIYTGVMAIGGVVYGHNDLIEKDYKSHWQLFSYTLPMDEKTIIRSKFITRGILIMIGFLLALLADVIFSVAAMETLSISHFKNMTLILFGYSIICMSDIPMMLRYKTQGKEVAFILSVTMPFMVAGIYGLRKFLKFCYAEGKRLYPDMGTDVSMKKVAWSYIMPYRDAAVWILPVLAVAALVLLYFWSIRELKRRRY